MEAGRLRGDLIEVFTMMRGLNSVDRENMFPLAEGPEPKDRELR